MITFLRHLVLVSALALVLPAAGSAEPSASRARAGINDGGVRLASEADRACLAEAVYFEAGHGAEAQAAVAHVILNRARDPRFPKSVCGVVRQGCQFSYRCSGRSLALKDPKKRAGAIRTAEAVLTGAPDITGGALFFHSARAKAGWFSSRKRVGEIGGNIFYR